VKENAVEPKASQTITADEPDGQNPVGCAGGAELPPKRRKKGGNQIDKRPYSMTGINSLKAAITRKRHRGKVRLTLKDRLDMRYPETRRLLAWQGNLIADLGGEENLSTQKRTLVDIATRTKLFLSHLDSWLIEQGSLVNFKRRTVFPVLLQRMQLADSLMRNLAMLGLERQAKPVMNLAQYLEQRASVAESQQSASEPTVVESNEAEATEPANG